MCWPWAHHYETTAARSTDVYDSSLSTERPIERFTQLLQVCSRCGKARTRKIEGAWTGDDLRGAP